MNRNQNERIQAKSDKQTMNRTKSTIQQNVNEETNKTRTVVYNMTQIF